MRTRRLVSILPLVLLGSACSVDSTEVDTQDAQGTQDSNISVKAEGRGLEQFRAQRPDFFRGAGDVSFKRAVRDEKGLTHERVSQSFRGVPVFAAEAILHLDANGSVASITDRLVRDLKVNTTPKLRAAEAEQIAVAQVGGSRALTANPKSDLQILPESNGNVRLTWRVQLESASAEGVPSKMNFFIDAHTGEIAKQFDALTTQRNRKTYTAKNRTSLPGTLVRSEGQGASGDAVLDQAHDNAGLTYDYYFNTFGRDSFDGNGATITSTVHYSRRYVNAFWDGTQMVYGDGDGTQSGPLTVLDVVGHELTHAVTSYSSNLVYSSESGALNEAMSDVFGASIEAYRDGAVSANTWKIGEECWTPGTAGDALRYMNDPALAGDYDYYPTRYTGTSDNGGVHWNSGIANLAFKLMVTGGTHPRGKTTNVVPALDSNAVLSMQKGAAIFYRANTVYLTPGSTFSEAREATVKAAADLYGAGSAAVTSVNEGWNAVGVPLPPTWTVISTLSNVSGATGSQTTYSHVTPAGATAMRFALSGGTGDADMYVKYGSAPTTSSYDCVSGSATSTETCTITGAKQGTYYVLIHGYTAYSGTTYTVSSGQ